MRIANEGFGLKRRGTLCARAALLIALGTLPSITGAYAADAVPTLMPPAPAPAASVNIPANENPAPPLDRAGSLQGINTAPTSAMPNMSSGAGSEISKSLTTLEDKASDNARGVVRHLDNSSDTMTLQDVNAARQAVARLDAMIDVEKHLAELDKVRNDRGSGHAPSSAASLAGAIPASALAPLPPQNMMPFRPIEREKPKLSSIEISRIMGSDGKYTAVLKLTDGTLKPVRAGDTISDHTTVRQISASTVLIEEGGVTRTLHIRNVDAIYSAMR